MLGMNIITAVAVLLIASDFFASDYIRQQEMCDVLVSVDPGAYSHITQACGASLLSFRRDGACTRDEATRWRLYSTEGTEAWHKKAEVFS